MTRLPDMDLPQGPSCETVAVGAHGDHVILAFPTPITWCALDPQTAKQVGEAIARSGYAVESKDNVYGKTPIIIEQIRKRLILAVEQMLRAEMIHNKLQPRHAAEKAVDLMLTEVS